MQFITVLGCEAYYRMRAAGFAETAPMADGDASNPMRIMTTPGHREPAKVVRRRRMGEMAPADRRR